eukprot:Nitzschia sp. Nitz4//scaffold226_size53432//12514//13231//NITZ4_006693-RA/size53432-processed-gene-0.33-mRNA-1//-1//CDS//3329542727//5468//frame0
MWSVQRFLQASLFVALCFTSNVSAVEEVSNSASQQRRELFDFFDLFSLLAAHLGPHPCYKPLGEPDFGKPGTDHYLKCMQESMSDSSSSSSTSDSSSSSSSSNSASNSYNSYVDVSEEEGVAEYQGQETAGAGGSSGATAGFELWMMFVAGSVLSALVAVHMGQKKPSLAAGRHELSGAVSRRNGAVNAFADGAFQNGTVEMQSDVAGESETPYAMA